MKYADGTDIKPGDVVQIDTQYRGRVIASMDTGEYLPKTNKDTHNSENPYTGDNKDSHYSSA